MSINEYLAHLENFIHASPIVSSYTLTIDRKTNDIVFLSGNVEFIDGSALDMKEFIESEENDREKYKYGYNYRKGAECIFRYDNAPDPKARKLSTFPHHKHTATGGLLPASSPSLEEIFEEITDHILDTWKL